jgi:GH18 family chitinase
MSSAAESGSVGTDEVVGQYFGFFNGVPKAHYAEIVGAAPFDACDLLLLAFVHALEQDGSYVAGFTNWRDNDFPLDPADTDAERVRLIVATARAKNPQLPILISLGWGTNDAGNAASTPHAFAASVAAIVEDFDLDGFDIDFESTSVEPSALLTLAQELRQSLGSGSSGRSRIMTITPAQEDGLDAAVLETFDYVMPQTYDHGGNGTTADWFAAELGSYAKIVFGLNSEGHIGQSDDPNKFASEAKKNGAAGIFAWRLDNDSLDPDGFPTFATGREMWELMHSA